VHLFFIFEKSFFGSEKIYLKMKNVFTCQEKSFYF